MINDYYSIEAVSQSELKKYLHHPRDIDVDKEDSDDIYAGEDTALTKGSIVDLLVTNPDAEEIIVANYLAIKDVNISDTIKNIIREVHRISGPSSGESLENFKELVFEQCNAQNYYMNRKKDSADEDKRVSDIISNNDSLEYFEYLKQREGKILVSQSMLDTAYTVANSISVNDTYLRLSDGCDVHFQFPFVRDYSVFYNEQMYMLKTKGLLDIMLVNESKKQIYIVDVKALMSRLSRFFSSVFKFRYDIQGSFYSFFISEMYPGYEVFFFNLAGSFADPTHTEVFHYPKDVLRTARVGKPKKHVLGWENLMQRKIFYQENGFNYTPEYISSGGMNIVEMFENE